MRRHFEFDRARAIREAWDFLWARNLENRAKSDAHFALTGRREYRWAETYYLTAADLEYQVRSWARDTANGKPWDKTNRAWPGDGYGIRMSGDLNGDIRHWLLRNPNITGHNFGRGHISGMRFRPVGEPISPVEAETIKKKEARKDRPTLTHLRQGGRPACIVAQQGKRRFSPWRQTKAWTTSDPEKVTCPRCLKLAAKPAEGALLESRVEPLLDRG